MKDSKQEICVKLLRNVKIFAIIPGVLLSITGFQPFYQCRTHNSLLQHPRTSFS